jgi:flagellar biosynthesis/type III secretory pathway chaperone
MASTFTTLGIELMATGENAGTWGTKTNTNLSMVQSAIAGYVEKSIAGGSQTTALSITDGDNTESTSVARQMVIKLTGTITGNQIVTVPDSLEKLFVVVNGTSGSFTVQFKTASGTGITFAAADKGTKFFFSDGTNINEIISQTIPADTITTGDSASSFATSSGAVVIDSQASTTTVDGHTGVTIQSTNSGDITLDSVADIVLDAAGNDFSFKASGTEILKITNSSSDVVIKPIVDAKDIIFQQRDGTEVARIEDNATFNVVASKLAIGGTAITSTAAELNLVDGITAGTVSASLAVIVDSNKDITGFRNLTTTGDAVVGGDLTISGDDLTMATNTAGNLLIADGTNFNPIPITDLSAITTIAADDTFLAVDNSGGGLKKVARSVVVAGLATSSALTEIVQDTSPQLGGNLDTNSFMIDFDDAHGIRDENGNEQIIFQTTSSAVNQFDVTNAATGNPPSIKATGGDSNIDFNISAKGTGHVTVLGDTNSGAIQFNCESNSHGQIVIAQPHSAAVTNTLTLPAGSSSTLVSLVSTDTLTNKTLTTPIIAEIDNASDITLDAGGDIILDAAGNDWSFKAAGTEVLKITNSSSDVIIKPIVDAKDIIFQQRDGTEVARIEDNATFNVVTGKLAINGTAITSTAAELNLVDGITAGTVSASLAVIVDSNADITGFRNVTLSGELDAATGDFSSTVDIAGQLTVADGSAGAPSISNTGDTNTGLLFSAADKMQFSSGGTAQFTMEDGAIIPVTDNDIDLGTASLEFKNVYVDGTVFADALGFGTVVMTLPTADGSANQILVTDGSGALSFTDNSGGTSWQSVKTANYTASAGEGIFANTTSASFTVTLPASPSIGDEVSIKDYAGTFDTNALTIGRNSQPIEGVAADLTVSVERAGLTLAYSDSTQGWLLKDK